ncbi:MAG TPA: hypothetical protein DCL41_10525 [Bdellovibrionales bacterium]|nr:hypothetical protein [Pseudobdellovibrionaceae bacterium]HAG92300.1 hypothetical protein [Bdellovibrionales bacterium]
MKKAFSFSFFVVSIIALATLLFFNGPGDRPTLPAVEEAPSQAKVAKVLTEVESPKGDQKEPASNRTLAMEDHEKEAQKWVDLFLDSAQSMETRLEAWVALKKIHPLPLKSYVRIANAKNPFQDRDFKPHTKGEESYRREESFRIMALQSLEEALIKDPTQISSLMEVAQNASSPVVKKIASKMKEFAEQGMNYSDLFNQAVLQEEIPR